MTIDKREWFRYFPDGKVPFLKAAAADFLERGKKLSTEDKIVLLKIIFTELGIDSEEFGDRCHFGDTTVTLKEFYHLHENTQGI